MRNHSAPRDELLKELSLRTNEIKLLCSSLLPIVSSNQGQPNLQSMYFGAFAVRPGESSRLSPHSYPIAIAIAIR